MGVALPVQVSARHDATAARPRGQVLGATRPHASGPVQAALGTRFRDHSGFTMVERALSSPRQPAKPDARPPRARLPLTRTRTRTGAATSYHSFELERWECTRVTPPRNQSAILCCRYHPLPVDLVGYDVDLIRTYQVQCRRYDPATGNHNEPRKRFHLFGEVARRTGHHGGD